ncbi:hypothetical protein Cni_G16427 [Canna indica]|uniref:Transposase MuDR plant domain-containing protein n=1 Tax=Canna indica TaxID=4628 RepID=A0AAQ3QGS1_9LILI|nr:hypothetical protein Cni_G16427 [Canna indica]
MKDSDYTSSDDLRSIDGSDNSNLEPRRRNKEFNPLTDTDLKVGQEFNDHKSSMKALKDWSIKNGYDYNSKANETRKVTVVCKVEDCPWRVHASKDQEGKMFVVKTYAGSHTCGRQFRNNKVSARWVALKYLENFRDSPSRESNSLKKAVQREHMVFISDDKASRAKNIALKIILGDEKQQFANVRRYAKAVLESNPESTYKIKKNDSIFQRMHVCFKAYKKGFLIGCRKIIGLDGCHLKSKFKG